MSLLASSSARRRPLILTALLLLVLGVHAGHGVEGHGSPEESGHGAEGEHGGLEASGGHETSSAEGHGSPSEHGSSGGGEHGAESSEHGGQPSEHGGQPSEHGGQSAGGHHGGGSGSKAHHGGGGKHGGGGHHVVEVSAQERSIAYLMMFAVAAAMVLLFFVNYSDPDVRCASSKMICTAVSVYCAVLLNQAIFSFIFEQLLVGEDGRGLGMKQEDIKPWMHVVIGGMIFVPMLAGLNLMCWRHQNHPNRLVASSQLGAHMVAWAGINTFGSLQASDAFHKELLDDITLVVGESEKVKAHAQLIKYIAVIMIGFCTFIFLFGLSKYIRTKILERLAKKRGYTLLDGGKREVKMAESKSEKSGGPAGGAETPEDGGTAGGAGGPSASKKLEPSSSKASVKSKASKEEPEEEEHWLEELCEGEREAMALVLGFLTQQTVVYLITGKVVIPIHGLHDHRKVHEVILMGCSSLMTFIILLWVAVSYKTPGRTIFNFRGYLAMTMAWLFERSGEWYMHRFFTLPFARIWSAFILTGFAIFATVAIDKFADNTADRKRRTKLRETVDLEELVALDKYYELKLRQKQAASCALAPAADCQEAPVPDSELKEPDMINGVPCSRLALLHRDLRDETPTDISVQTLSIGFSVLIGIVWDMAFESAEGLIVADGRTVVPAGKSALPVATLQEWLIQHPVIGKNGLAFILCAIVLPGWIYYIVPPARKAWRHHLEDILLEQRQVPRKHHRLGHAADDIET